MTRSSLMMIAIAAGASTALGGVVGTTVVDFEDGTTQGWQGPAGPGGSSFIDPTAGVGGGAGYRTQFNNFGITFANSTNSAFVGDFSGFDEVTIGVDVRVDQIGTFLPVSRPWLVELRSTTLAQGGYPWTSVYFVLDNISQANNADYQSYSVTFDPTSGMLPAGWGGYGAEDPMTFEPILPDGVTFADVLANVDEIAFTTLQPGFFFTFDDYDVTLDNISITAVPTPGALSLLAFAGIAGTRRRR